MKLRDKILIGLFLLISFSYQLAHAGTFTSTSNITPQTALGTRVADSTGVTFLDLATSAGQTTGNVSLAAIVAALTNPLPVSAASLPLPSGAATLSEQVSQTTVLSSINTNLGLLATEATANTTKINTTNIATAQTDKTQFTKLTDGTDTALITPAGELNVTGTVATGGLTDAQLRATPVPVSGTVTANAGTNLNTSLLATSANQTNATQQTKITDGSLVVDVNPLNVQVVGTDNGLITNSVIHGLTTAGGGAYVDVKVNPSGTLTVDASGTTVPISAVSLPLPALAATSTIQTDKSQFTKLTDGTDTALITAAGELNVTGTVTTGGLTDAQLRATPVPVSGTVTANAGTNLNTSLLATSANQTTLGSQTTKINDGVTVAGVIVATTALKTDMSSVAGTATVTAAAGVQKVGIVGNANAAIDAANNATAPANVIVAGAQLQSGASATVGTAGQVGSIVAGLDHVLYARLGSPVLWSCFVPLTTTATTECRAAPAAGLKLYVSSLNCSNGAATVQGVDVVFGTGANCGTGTTALTHKYQMGTNALTTSPFQVEDDFLTGLVPTAATAICVRPTAATAFGCTLTGFTAP